MLLLIDLIMIVTYISNIFLSVNHKHISRISLLHENSLIANLLHMVVKKKKSKIKKN